MTSTFDNNSLSSDQDTNQFLVQVGIEPQISYTTIRDFTSLANQNPQKTSNLDDIRMFKNLSKLQFFVHMYRPTLLNRFAHNLMREEFNYETKTTTFGVISNITLPWSSTLIDLFTFQPRLVVSHFNVRINRRFPCSQSLLLQPPCV